MSFVVTRCAYALVGFVLLPSLAAAQGGVTQPKQGQGGSAVGAEKNGFVNVQGSTASGWVKVLLMQKR